MSKFVSHDGAMPLGPDERDLAAIRASGDKVFAASDEFRDELQAMVEQVELDDVIRLARSPLPELDDEGRENLRAHEVRKVRFSVERELAALAAAADRLPAEGPPAGWPDGWPWHGGDSQDGEVIFRPSRAHPGETVADHVRRDEQRRQNREGSDREIRQHADDLELSVRGGHFVIRHPRLTLAAVRALSAAVPPIR